MREHAPAEPFGHEAERVRICVLDARALDPRIEVVDIDELRTPIVGRCRDCARELLVTELGGDQHDLAGLDIRPEHSELGEAAPAITHQAGDPISRGEHRGVTFEAATERFLGAAGISQGTRRVYAADLREFAAWFGPAAPSRTWMCESSPTG